MKRIRFWIVPLACLLLAGVPKAFAHATLVRSTPADHTVVHSRNLELALDYNSRIDVNRSSVTLTGPSGQSLPLEREASAGPAELKAAAHNLANGNYRIHWQVLASDGHITRGDVAFTVDAH